MMEMVEIVEIKKSKNANELIDSEATSLLFVSPYLLHLLNLPSKY